MTDAELAKFIKTVYFTFDRALVPKELSEYVAAWAPYLKEFDYEVAQQILPNVCLGKEYPPRPWEIRVALIDHAKQIAHPPSTTAAWVFYQQLMAEVASGAVQERVVHPVVHATLASISGMGLNNQFDAKRFESLYEDKVKEWFKNTYWIGTNQ